MTGTCNVCLERYQREINPPLTCNPCGHVTCQPCLTNWFQLNHRTCPECRTTVTSTTVNRAVLDLLETRDQPVAVAPRLPTGTSGQLSEQMLHISTKRGELVRDRCQYGVYVIDNSYSMDNYDDGKLFTENPEGSITATTKVARWEEAVSKTLQIAKYNIQRNMSASYYLLNPKGRTWVENTDFVKINPGKLSTEGKHQALHQLAHHLLLRSNIRGNTPLDRVTLYFREHIIGQASYPICYNIITDGEPNSRPQFEQQLRYLCEQYHIFLVINLCTDSDSVVNYYNTLDTSLGGELSGMDVLDDLKSEADEVWLTGNRSIPYSLSLHICRMAGCYSVISDWLDEIPLEFHYITKLIREITGDPADLSWNYFTTDPLGYLATIDRINRDHPKVYDIRTFQFTPVINRYWFRYLLFRTVLRGFCRRTYLVTVLVSVLLYAVRWVIG